MQRKLEANYPVKHKNDVIEWGVPQWVEGDNSALMYRGRELKRGKMWFQDGDPKVTRRFLRYFYTGWQYNVLPATSDINQCPELKPTYDAYNALVTEVEPAWKSNHLIVTHYKNGEANIGQHSDKTKSIVKDSLITVLKTGDVGRPFCITSLDGEVELFNEIVQPGDAIVMTLEANTKTKHGVPALDGQAVAASGSIVFRSISESVAWDELAKHVQRNEEKKRKREEEKGELKKDNNKIKVMGDAAQVCMACKQPLMANMSFNVGLCVHCFGREMKCMPEEERTRRNRLFLQEIFHSAKMIEAQSKVFAVLDEHDASARVDADL